MIHNKVKRLVFLLIPFFLLVSSPASFANSLPVYWQGYPSYETLTVDKNSPIEVKSEHLLFDLTAFNQQEYTITGEVTATYEMFNPTPDDVTVQMAFPFICKMNDFSQDDISISVDDENLPFDLYIGEVVDSYGFSIEQENILVDFSKVVQTISTGSYQGKNFSQTDEGILYTFEVVPKTEEQIHFAVDYNEINSDRTKIVTDGFHAFSKGQNYMQVSGWCSGQTTFEIFVLGEDVSFDIKGYTDGSHKEKIDDFTYSVSQKVVDVKSFINNQIEKTRSHETEYSKIIDSSVFNFGQSQLFKMYLSAMDEALSQNGYASCSDFEGQFFVNRLLILVYTVHFPANSVKSVIVGYNALGTMDSTKTNKPLYTFTYLLNPARYWAAFNNLNIEIITPNQAPHMVESSIELDNVKPRHFTTNLPSLPENDLTFTIHSNKKILLQENMGYGYRHIYSFISHPIILVILMLIIFAIVTVIAFILYRKKK